VTRVTEPDEFIISALKAAVDPIEADAERVAHVQAAIAALIAAGADPALVGAARGAGPAQGWVTQHTLLTALSRSPADAATRRPGNRRKPRPFRDQKEKRSARPLPTDRVNRLSVNPPGVDFALMPLPVEVTVLTG
jgi:hypothetical protein